MNQILKNQRLQNLVGHIDETMPNGPLKNLKSFLRSTPARHIKF